MSIVTIFWKSGFSCLLEVKWKGELTSVLFFLLFKQGTWLDKYDYAMHGRVFKVEYPDNQDDKRGKGSGSLRVAIYVSQGGLLLRLEGEHR